MSQTYDFPEVTLLVTHYNRSQSLENLLNTYQKLECRFGAIIVSDDGSAEQHTNYLKKLQEVFVFQLLTTPSNRGLGHNINKGQDAVKTPYTLYVQEDFEPTSVFPDRLVESLTILKEHPDFDIIRFYSYRRYPYLKSFSDSFSEMAIPPLAIKYNKLHSYSDHPHLRHSSFLERFGRYVEGIAPDKTEYRMCVSYIQHKGKGLFYNEYQKLFHQKNSPAEPSTYGRKKWSESNNMLLISVRNLYRQIKYNYDLYLSRPRRGGPNLF